MAASLAHTPLHDVHVHHGARMVDFAGWSMPVQYSSIVAEHTATRTAAGIFDISHMGRLRLRGTGAAALLDRLVTRSVANLRPGQIRYSLVTNQQGGILDDVLVYDLEEPDGNRYFLLVVNAGNREKIVGWFQSQLSSAEQAVLEDLTGETAMLAVQGPRANGIVSPLIDTDLSQFRYYSGAVLSRGGQMWIVSRTGYTGEDGCELIVPAGQVVPLWQRILDSGRTRGLLPAGLGARDTLRQEAAMPLYGHELSEQINPYQAGLAFAVNLAGRDFVGHEALTRLRDDPALPRRVGLRLPGRRSAREHYAVLDEDEQVGEVTSGTFSPTLGCPIAMAYVRPEFAEVGRQLAVDVRGSREPAEVVPLPFYSRTS